MAAAQTMAAPTDSWFSVKAAANSAVDIVIFDDIGAWGISAKQFERELREVASGATLIRVNINSLGGDVIDGTAIYNMLKNHSASVHVFITGIAASMASVIAMAGDVIHIADNAWMMIHKPWGYQGGNSDDMREYADFLDNFEAGLLKAYEQKTGKTTDELKDMLRSETWLMGQSAIDMGFANVLTNSVEASAKLQSNRVEDFNDMPPQAKNMVSPRAQGSTVVPPAAGADVQPVVVAPVSQPAVSQAPVSQVAAQKTEAEITAQALAGEQARRDSVNAVFNGFPAHAELMQACMNDMSCTENKAREQLLAKLGEQSAPAGGQPVAGIAGHFTNGNIIKDAMVNAIGSRAGIVAAEADNSYVGLTMIEAARMCLTERGVSAYGQDRMGVVASAFTHSSSDFGNILQDVARKSLERGYEFAQETFQQWTTKANLSDFKINKSVALESFPTLDKVAEGGEYKQATFGDRGENIQLATYGKMFSITRQAIINDDLGAFTEIPMHMGSAAIRTLGNLVYAVLAANPKMADGTALFNAAHGNLMDAAYPSVESLQAARVMMGLQMDGTKTPLNIRPEFLLTSLSQEGAMKSLVASEFDPANADAKMPNVVRNMAQVIGDARLDHADKNAFKPWFAVNKRAIKVAYLDGNEMPQLDQQQGWSVDGTQFKVRLDAGVAPASYRSIVKNPGKAAG